MRPASTTEGGAPKVIETNALAMISAPPVLQKGSTHGQRGDNDQDDFGAECIHGLAPGEAAGNDQDQAAEQGAGFNAHDVRGCERDDGDQDQQ